MMGTNLRDLEIKVSYSSLRGDNILEDFYIPCLSKCRSYKRIAGYFSSTSLAVAAKGLAKFIADNNGTMKLVCNACLSESDKSVIEEYVEKIQNDFIVDLEKLRDELTLDHLKCLGWMLKNGKLEIKIAVLDCPPGIQHEKIGIMEDFDGNIISFVGSENETWMGWTSNNEKFHVFRSWNPGELEHLQTDIEDFDSYWSNKAKRAHVYTISEAVTKRLIQIAPTTNEDFAILVNMVSSQTLKQNEAPSVSTTKEWWHKRLALDAFLNKKHGIIQMATGTGKTSVAINILNRLLSDVKINGAIFSTFGNDLLDQWADELNDKANGSLPIYRYYNGYHELEDFFGDCVNSILLISCENLHRLFGYKKALKSKIIVIDEVHRFGSPSLREALNGKMSVFEYRLGLSATAEREYDEDGNIFIESEIGPVIFNYELKNAIEDGILCELDYIPLHYFLSEEDKEAIKEAYGRYSGRLKNGVNEWEAKKQLFMELARVKKLSKNKLPIFKDFIFQNPQYLENCIVFVEEKAFGNYVQDILISLVPNYHTYYHDDEKSNLEKFASGNLKLLITCKRLSQGIDIRSVKNIILFSANRGQLETIQRIGRCIRTDPHNPAKRAAVIDFISEKPDKTAVKEDNADEEREKWLSNLAKTKRRIK